TDAAALVKGVNHERVRPRKLTPPGSARTASFDVRRRPPAAAPQPVTQTPTCDRAGPGPPLRFLPYSASPETIARVPSESPPHARPPLWPATRQRACPGRQVDIPPLADPWRHGARGNSDRGPARGRGRAQHRTHDARARRDG